MKKMLIFIAIFACVVAASFAFYLYLHRTEFTAIIEKSKVTHGNQSLESKRSHRS